MDKLTQLENLANGFVGMHLPDSRVAVKDGPDYWLLLLDGWRPVAYDTLPVKLPNGQDIYGQLVHFEKMVLFADRKEALMKLIEAGRIARSGLVGAGPVPPVPPAERPNLVDLFDKFKPPVS